MVGARRSAAAHRPASCRGSAGIFNHLTLVVAGPQRPLLSNSFGMHWSEVTASTFMSRHRRRQEQARRRRGGTLLLLHPRTDPQQRPQKAVFHTHMPYASADASRRPAHQGDRPDRGRDDGEIAYDDERTGPALDPAEGESPRRGDRRQDGVVLAATAHHGRRHGRRCP